MELMMSPIFGLMMVVMNLPLPGGLVERKIVFEYTEASHVLVDFFGVSQLTYRMRPQPRPP